ncbi:alternate-type signal peptide domain-containing protein [Lysinibacter cavernae]|uniref:Alternate signal-mediated exported protein n=1 Tax=Lysinibacter cavernae TaxID=1640652 RepID=A0A7X5QZN7_9MICO|nr:alternate-type signal peptide domain-containing protein [Lysinibacter cavernae]NIH52980.1 alternate signal-mediated exported protein [Lysinibacter cavernae]
MNKLTKSLIATATGTALLIGGGGTLAAWNSGAFASLAATISAGDLSLSAPEPGKWSNSTGETINLDEYRVAPGDILLYETTVDLTAKGDNLHGEITLDPTSISPANPGKPEDVALATRLLKSAAIAVNGRSEAVFTASPGTQQIRVSTTISWPDEELPALDNTAMQGSVILSGLTFTATQTIPSSD